MWFIDQISDWLLTVTGWFYKAYQTASDWISPFNWLAGPLLSLADAFAHLSVRFTSLSEWVSWAEGRLRFMLTWDNVMSIVLSWFPWLEDIGSWFTSWWTNILAAVDSWWEGTKTTVLGWINIATQGVTDLIAAWDNFWNVTFPEWISSLSELRATWDNFWTVTWPALLSFKWLGIWWNSKWLEIESRINTWFKDYEPFWEGWQDWKSKVAEFFSDPLEFLLNQFTDWFLGPEE